MRAVKNSAPFSSTKRRPVANNSARMLALFSVIFFLSHSKKNFAIIESKEITLNDEQASFLTEDISLKEKASYVDFMTCAPCELLVIKKKNVFQQVRKIAGNNIPQVADNGTIRSRFGIDRIHNAVYTSPDFKTAEKEIEYFF